MLEQGHIATMYHAGSNSYARVCVLQPMTHAEVAAELEASTGNARGAKKIIKAAKKAEKKPVTDGEIFRHIILQVTQNVPDTVYSGINVYRDTKRLKAYRFRVDDAALAELTKRFKKAFGDRMVSCYRNKPYDAGYGSMSGGGDLCLRLHTTEEQRWGKGPSIKKK